MIKRPAVFFDRDGVLNQDVGYLYRPEEFVWIEGAIGAIRHFNTHGFLVFVITNQSGVARGYYSEEQVQALHAWMNEELHHCQARIDAFYYCPHHTAGKAGRYQLSCNCRKPGTGMIQQALEAWPVDLKASFMVGDKPSDIQCAENAGITGYRFTGGNLYEFLKQAGCIKESANKIMEKEL